MPETNQMQNDSPEMKFSGVYNFSSPVEFEGQTYDKVDYDLTKMKAKDVISCKKEAARLRNGDSLEALLTDDLLHASLFARSADLPGVFVLEMGAADYAAWATVAQAFFGSALSGLMS